MTMKRLVLIAALASCGAGAALAQGVGRPERIAPELLGLLGSVSPGQMVPVIIQFDRPPMTFGQAEGKEARLGVVKALREEGAAQRQQLVQLLGQNGALGVRDLWITGAVAAKVPAGLVNLLATRPGVVAIRLDGTIAAPETTQSTTGATEWNVEGIGAPAMWAGGFTGEGATVGVMDTGVDVDHPDLAARWRPGGWFDPYGENPQPADPVGHGTHVAGVAVGGNAGGTALGVAPGAQWIAAKIFNDAGTASYSGIHAAFQWMLDPDGNPDTDDAPDVVNSSWGLQNGVNACLREFEPDVAALRAAQIAPVFAAGNTGPGSASSTSPANYSAAISVGAIDSADQVADFSARGPSACGAAAFPSLSAPGVSVKTPPARPCRRRTSRAPSP
jgi:bacillopeptidase F